MKDITVRVRVNEDMSESQVFAFLDELEDRLGFADVEYDGAEWMDDEGVHYHEAG